jgi:chromatin assembly factor 1 subunit A
MMSQLSEAEVTGDAAVVRSYLDRLSDRTQFPAKVFIFDEDSRPGYFGTRSKSSTVIRPRKPFVQDAVVLDYSYDSGEEWEGEEEGAGDEVAGDDDDEEGEGAVEDEDSDADSWLVDDDEVEMPDLDRMSPISDVSLTGMSLNLPPEPTLPKRKVDVVGKEDKADQKKRKVVPLVPFIKGPCWESEVGVCEYVPFETYRIQLFNG